MALRDELEAKGFRLEVEDGTLYVQPASRLGEGDRARIRQLRDDLVALVEGEEAGAAAEPFAVPVPEPGPEPEPLSAATDRRSTAGPDDPMLERLAEGRRRLMADDGSPMPCTECGGQALRNGTHLCATCWQAWHDRRSTAREDSAAAA